MQNIESQINELTSFMQTQVYASLDEAVRAALVQKKVELCRDYFLHMAGNLNRNKYKGCFAPHKAVMILAVMELVKTGHFTTNVIRLDKELKSTFKGVWQEVVPEGSPFKCEYHNPFTYMDSEPFWNLTDEKGEAYISWEAFYAFAHEKSRLEIKRFLIRSIKSDTISKQYSDRHMDMNWRAAEDMAVLAPVLGFLLAI